MMQHTRIFGSWTIMAAALMVHISAGQVLAKPTYSSPVALTSDDRFAWVVNRDNDSVTVFEVGNDVNQKVVEIPVGDEPVFVALTPDDKKAYVTSAVDGTVSVIDAQTRVVIKTIRVGAEPFGCAVTPDGKKLYVANFSSDSVSVINTTTDSVSATITGVGPKPRGIAISDGGGPRDNVYVTQFLAQLQSSKSPADEGRDDAKEGRVTVISAQTNQILGTVALNPIADTGFLSNGSTLDQIARRRDANGAEIFDTVTGAYQNLLQGIFIKGDRAYVVGTCSSPNGPFRFNVNVQSCLSVININDNVEVGETFNMNRNVGFEAVGKRLFNTNPIAIAFKNNSNEGFVVAAATNRLLRVLVDANGNNPTINAPTNANDPDNIVRISLHNPGELPAGDDPDPQDVLGGKNPQGIAINSTDTRAYIMNFISRDMSVIDISGNDPTQYKQIARISSAALPQGGTLEAIIQRGHQLFNTSIGPSGTNENAKFPAGRMSDFGWGSCYGCHPDGLTDGETWMFADGPRQTISMESTAEHPQNPVFNVNINANGAPILPTFHQRVLNWSAIREEIQDFELNIRNVSGGQGLIANADGTQDPCVFDLLFNFPVPNPNCGPDREDDAATTTGRSADLDAIAAYISFGIRAPISPRRGVGNLDRGRQLFEEANCQSCHGGPNWTVSQVDFTPPPVGETITDVQLVRFLRDVGTFDPTDPNEFRANTFDVVPPARGVLGFNPPSLLSVFAGAPYFHNGSCETLNCVLRNKTHRSAGTGGVDTLQSSSDRQALGRFLKSIDAATQPINP